IPQRQELLARLDQLSGAGVLVNGIRRAGDMYFYFRRAPEENDGRLYVREGLTGPERALLDPEKLSSPQKRYSINSYSPSADCAFVSYSIAVAGTENGELRILETKTGRDLDERIDRARFSSGEWLPDGKRFL